MKTTVQSVREFNRFYTNILGLLDQPILDSTLSLAEARILYELYHRQPCTASDILLILQMDKGYLSRTLDQFRKKGLLLQKRRKEDGRSSHLTLTPKGNRAFEKLNHASNQQINSLLERIPQKEQGNLLRHMHSIRKIFNQYTS